VATKDDLVEWLKEAPLARGGSGTIAELCREIWQRHEPELRVSGDLFYTWQYDVRWAAYKLREAGILNPENERVGRTAPTEARVTGGPDVAWSATLAAAGTGRSGRLSGSDVP
jgi:hypothetical protein